MFVFRYYLLLALGLAVGSEKVSDGNRKCHDCESTVDGPCGEKLEGPGGISCLNAESTQCYKLIEYHEDNTFYKRHCMEKEEGYRDGCHNTTDELGLETLICVCSDKDNCNSGSVPSISISLLICAVILRGLATPPTE